MSISVKQVSKSFGSFRALEHVSLEVAGGSLVALLGPSGSGKTTLLRIIAGLEVPDAGTVLYQDEDVTEAAVKDRNVGFVFQHYALFRHMTVFENVAFGLRVRRWPRKRVKERVGELLRLIQLDGLAGSYPSQLSGGQRQRVALARALAPEPKVLLLDEPRPATAFVRSHELEILAKRNGRPSLEGKIVHLSPAGPVVKARVFAADFGVVLNVDVARDRYAELGLEVGDTVYVAPRDVRVYLQDYVI